MVACDVYRPAAIEQLHVIGDDLKIEVYSDELQKWLNQALKNEKLKNYDFSNCKKYLIKLKIKKFLSKYLDIHLGV